MAENLPPNGDYDTAAPWVVDAWEMRLRGHLSWRKIAKAVEKDRATVQKHVECYSQTMARIHEGEEVNPVGEYIDGSFQDLRGQHEICEDAQSAVRIGRGEDAYVEMVTDYRTRSAALKEVHAIRKDIATARGVTTDKRSVSLSGAVDTNATTYLVLDESGSLAVAKDREERDEAQVDVPDDE